MTIVMLIMLVNVGNIKLDRFLKYYFIYLFFYILSNVLTGYVGELIMKLVGTYLAAITLYLSTKKMVLKFNAGIWVIYTILTVAIFDAIITIGQFYGNPIALTIPDLVGINNLKEETMDSYLRLGVLHGKVVGGIVGEVYNGYFLCAASVLALYNNSNKIKIINWALCLFLLFSLFLVQERSGLYFGLFCVVIYILINSNNKRHSFANLILFGLILVLVAWKVSGLVSFDEMRYNELGLDEGGRNELAAETWDFIAHNLFGGEMFYHSLRIRDPHNVLANSFLFGGIIGGTIVFIIIIVQIFMIVKILREAFLNKMYNSSKVIFALLYLTYTLNSFFHNPSLPAGVAMFFVCWGMVVSNLELEKILRMKTRIE